MQAAGERPMHGLFAVLLVCVILLVDIIDRGIHTCNKFTVYVF